MQRILPFLVSFCLCSTPIFAQTKVQDVLWEDNFTSGIDAQTYPNLVSRYASTLRSPKGIMMVIPKDIYSTYDPTYFESPTSDGFWFPVRVVKSFSGSQVYDSIKLETTGVYFIDEQDLGWERYFSYQTDLAIGSSTYKANYTGKPYTMSNTRGNSIKLLCKDCKDLNFDGTIGLYANFYRDISFMEIESDYKDQLGNSILSPKKASNFPNPYNVNEVQLPPQTPGKFSDMSTLYAMQDYFCQLCAKDINNADAKFQVYMDCMQRSTMVSPNDFFIHFGLVGFKLVGYRTAITTDLAPESQLQQAEKRVLRAVDILGQTIAEPETYSGVLILIYEDGSKHKMFK